MNNPRFYRNILSLVCLFLLVTNCSSDDDGSDVISPQPKVFEGNVILSSQSDVDDFGLDGYNVIEGFLFIGVNIVFNTNTYLRFLHFFTTQTFKLIKRIEINKNFLSSYCLSIIFWKTK